MRRVDMAIPLASSQRAGASAIHSTGSRDLTIFRRLSPTPSIGNAGSRRGSRGVRATSLKLLEHSTLSGHATLDCAVAAAGLGLGMTIGVTEPAQHYSTYALVRRLLVEEALRYWPRYAIAFLLMGITAA